MFGILKYFREQRDRDRETLLAALDKLTAAQSRQADVAIEQSRALRAFIDSFIVTGEPPSRRVSTDESEAEAERLEWGFHGES